MGSDHVHDQYKFPQSLSLMSDSRSNARDPSFSSYLSQADGRFLTELTRSRSGQCGRLSADGEIGVFSADRYFNEDDHKKPVEKSKVVESGMRMRSAVAGNDGVGIGGHPVMVRPKISLGTSSVRSESSWHSQSALLRSFPRQASGRHGARKKNLLSTICCSCASMKSLKVDGQHIRNVSKESSRAGLNRADEQLKVSVTPSRESWIQNSKQMLHPTAYPLCDRAMGSPAFPLVEKLSTKLKEGRREENCGDDSFDLPANLRKSISLERKLTLLKWDDLNPRSADIYIPSAISVEYYTDAESDASSDLFELDSFTGKRKPSFSGQVPDSSVSGYATPTTGYAPSEVSVDWSVVTASAADFSVRSDFGESKPAMPVTNIPDSTGTMYEKHNRNKENASHGFLGCANQKGVTVVENNVNYHQTTKRDKFTPASRVQASVKPMLLDAKMIQASRTASRSHSGRQSQHS